MSQQLWQLVLSPPPIDDSRHGRTSSDSATIEPRALSARDATRAAQIRAGDVATFEAVFREEYAGLVTYLIRTVGTNWDAEELVQGVFVQLWERRESFAPTTSVRNYLYGAVRHAALNHFRANRRATPSAGSSTSSPVDTELELDELTRAAYAAIEQLPPRGKEIWRLHRDHGMTVPEIAAHLNISPNTVKTQLARSLAAVRRAVVPFLLVMVAVRG